MDKLVEFRIKGNKYSSMPIKWQGNKMHLNGGRNYDSEKLNIPFEEIKAQLGANIEWSNEAEVPKAQ